ncbi:MAG: hypothetical protein EHM72_09730 [Calditrichaeota bacterium]|nr:MAG: hypothetical protein EHM72_09730 [Calditrichota bacterium]
MLLGSCWVCGGTFGIAFKYWPTAKIALRLGAKYDDYTNDRDMEDGTYLQKNLGSSIQFSAEHQLYSARQISLHWGGRLAYNKCVSFRELAAIEFTL